MLWQDSVLINIFSRFLFYVSVPISFTLKKRVNFKHLSQSKVRRQLSLQFSISHPWISINLRNTKKQIKFNSMYSSLSNALIMEQNFVLKNTFQHQVVQTVTILKLTLLSNHGPLLIFIGYHANHWSTIRWVVPSIQNVVTPSNFHQN